MKRICLCADDYSQSAEINRAILELVEKRRLGAVSCLSQSPSWPEDARRLAGHEVQAGLHFNLTLPFRRKARSVFTVMAAAVSGLANQREIAKAFDDQWRAFEKHYGKAPAFVDGHQHVHVFPGILDVVLRRVAALEPTCWIRSLKRPGSAGRVSMKQRLLSSFSRDLERMLAEAELKTNPFFEGFRNYDGGRECRDDWADWLRLAEDGTLIMCHPGMPSDDPADPIRHCRPDEYGYLASDVFPGDLERAGVVLADGAGYGASFPFSR